MKEWARRDDPRSRAFEAARQVHRLLIDDDGELQLPVDVERAAELLGLRVRRVDGIAGRLLENRSGRRVSGLLDFARGLLWVNATDSPARQRFTIAHEIAHEVLDHETRIGTPVHAEWGPEAPGDDPPDAPGAEGVIDALEREADVCAAAMLVPPDELARRVALIGPSIPLLAPVFGVSCGAMRLQLSPWLPTLEEP